MNTVTKQRDPDTAQHSLLFQVLGLYRHCTCLANIITFIQREHLITLKKSPPPRIPRSTPPPPLSLWINAKEDPLGG